MTEQEYDRITSTPEGTLRLSLSVALKHVDDCKTGIENAILSGKELAEENTLFRSLLSEAEITLADYIQTIEGNGGKLYHGRKVLKDIRTALGITLDGPETSG